MLGLCGLLGCAGDDGKKTTSRDGPEVRGEPWKGPSPKVVIETSRGTIVAALYGQEAPVTVKNFMDYVDAKHYDGTIFHRVIPNFMIQGGGFEPGMKERKDIRKPIQNEADNGLRNQRGTLAMARTGDPHSATAQFFINVENNDFLDHKSKTPKGWGYCVFGKVIEGMDVVDKIRAVKTGDVGFHENVPLNPVMILSIRRVEEKETEKDKKP
jgi:cyclophilin family peptidyl-prolyl cis-trans isomerase